MSPLVAILLVAVLFAVFALLTRRSEKKGCDPNDCVSCHLRHPTPESNDEHK